MAVVVVDYGAGNLKSAAKALAAAAAASAARAELRVTADPDAVRKAERIVLPGVGAFADCKRGIESHQGLVEALDEAVIRKGQPFLGICVGMQLMATTGIEYGEHAGLDWIKGQVVRLTPDDPDLKIPQIGWNDLEIPADSHPLLEGIGTGTDLYFVHSYHFVAKRATDVLARIDYGGPVTAVIGRDNMVGVQFHPEKSQAAGLKLLANFLQWRP